MNEGIALVTRRTIRATAARLFEAWTQPDQIRRWWGPRPVTCSGAEIDLRVGGRYRIANLLPDGKTLIIEGEFQVIEAPHRLVYTWRAGDDRASRVTVRFEARGEATRGHHRSRADSERPHARFARRRMARVSRWARALRRRRLTRRSPLRPEVGAVRVLFRARRQRSGMVGASSGAPPTHAAARSSKRARWRSLRVSDAARSNSAAASLIRPSLARSSARALGKR